MHIVKYSLEECLAKEATILDRLEEITINSLPIWRLVRNTFRRKIVDDNSRSTVPIIKVTDVLRNFFLSFFGLLKIVLLGKSYSNVFFPHSRLFLVSNQYLERFSDPLIDYSEIGEDYIILERPQNGTHNKPRYHGNKVIYLDFIEIITRICLPVAQQIVSRKYKNQIDLLCKLLNSQFEEANVWKYKVLFSKIVAERLLQYHLTKIVLTRLNPKRIFLAHRETFNYVIAYAKKKGVMTIELQHGITVGETVLYSGRYDARIDPDYFFIFGESNIGPQFSMPIERLRNVGYAYKNYITDIGLNRYPEHYVLAISEPRISDVMVNTLLLLAVSYPQYVIHIRCHPQEKLSEEMLDKISKYKNIEIVSNTYESFCALSQYSCIIGENSSVLYEAMSLHKKVGRINFNGLEVKETALIHGGFKINKVEDFETFMTKPYSDENDSKELYSDFKIENFKSIL